MRLNCSRPGFFWVRQVGVRAYVENAVDLDHLEAWCWWSEPWNNRCVKLVICKLEYICEWSWFAHLIYTLVTFFNQHYSVFFVSMFLPTFTLSSFLSLWPFLFFFFSPPVLLKMKFKPVGDQQRIIRIKESWLEPPLFCTAHDDLRISWRGGVSAPRTKSWTPRCGCQPYWNWPLPGISLEGGLT